MPRTLPSAFANKIGQSSCFFVWLVELRLASGTKYFSKGMDVTYNGHSWKARILGIDGLSAAYIDGTSQDFATPTFRFSNLSDDGSTNFFFTGLDSAESFVNREVRVHLYDVDSGVALDNFWEGYLGSPTYSEDGSEMEIGATFLWHLLNLVAPKLKLAHKCQYAFFNETWDGNDSIGCPYHTFGTAGFTSCAHNGSDCSARGMLRFYPGWPQIGLDSAKRGREDIRKAAVPVVYGAGFFNMRPHVYLVRVFGNELWINFIISGVHPGLPFDPADIDPNTVKIFGSTKATAVDFKYGAYPESLPTNLDRFPDGLGHSLVCHGWATFPLTNEQKDNLNIDEDEVRIGLNNGRKIQSTGLPSGNPALQLRDYIQDKVFCLGLADSAFNLTIQAGTEAYVGTRYQTRYIFNEQTGLMDNLQKMLRDFHGYVTFDNAQMAIGCKRNDSTPVATFGTGGRMILNNYVKFYEKPPDELKNQLVTKFRRQTYHPDELLYDDKGAQQTAGNGIETVVSEEFESLGLYDPGGDLTQIQINAAIYLREMLNGNAFIEFDVALNDGIDILPGEIIRVNNVRILNNATNNYLFRVLPYKIDVDNYTIHFTCQIYKSVFYEDTADPIGTDVIRTTDDTTRQGRPPDVIPQQLTLVDVVPNGTEGKQANLRGTFTIPAYDSTIERSQGIFRAPPISEVEIWWRYTDEPIHAARFGNRLSVIQQATNTQGQIDFGVEFFKSRSVEAYFVAIGPNRSHAQFGYIPDPTKATALTANLSNVALAASVVSSVPFHVGDYAQIEREIVKIGGVFSGQVNFDPYPNSFTPPRTSFFGTVGLAHASGTQIVVVKQSYPSLIRALGKTFTYLPVVERDVLQRGGDALVVRWFDPTADNVEQIRVYKSTDADANTNPNKLGSATPAWYLADPDSPPSGVTFQIASRQTKLRYEQEDIGPVGTVAYFRIAARNGNYNFSSRLSGLLSSTTVAGGTVPPTDAPSTPQAGDVITNIKNVGTNGEAQIVCRVYADVTRTKTFSQVGTTELVLVFQLPNGKLWKPGYKIEDGSVTFVEVPLIYTLGGVLTWIGNRAWNSGGPKNSAAASVVIAAGGYATNAALITGLAISGISTVSTDQSELGFAFTQPATPVLLSHALIMRQLPSAGSFKKVLKYRFDDEAVYLTTGLVTVSDLIIPHPKKSAIQWKVRLVSVDGTFIDSPVFNATSPDSDTGPPNNGTAIPITRAVIKHGRTLLVEPVIPTVQMESFWRLTLIIHDNGAIGGVRRYYDPATSSWGTTLVELTDAIPTIGISKAELFAGGRTAIYCKVGVWNRFNGGSATYSADVPAVGTGQIPATGAGTEPATGDTDVATGLVAPDVQDYFGELQVSCLKPSTNAATIKRYQVILSTQGPNLPPAGAPTQGLEGVQRVKEGQASPFRNKQGSTTTIYFYFRVENDFGFSGWSPSTSVTGNTIGRPLVDFIGNGVPILPMALERNATSGTGHTATTFTLDVGASAIPNFYATTPPMVLHIPSLPAIDTTRNILAYNSTTKQVTVDVPYSATPPNSITFEIHRGLYKAGKSATGHTTTRFFLDSSAPATDDALNGKTLYIPSAPAGQRIHKIVTYIGSTRRCNLEPLEDALAAAPGNNVCFMINDGSFGYAASNLTGVIAPVPFRVWLNDETDEIIGEPISPTGENSFSLSEYHYQALRAGTGAVRDDQKKAIAKSPVFSFPAANNLSSIRIRFANLYRDGGSDGYSAFSFYSPGYKLTQAGVSIFYSPGVYVPISVDYEDDLNYPSSRYPY